MAQIAVKVTISGKVQGVFFRMETQKAARAAGVNGYVNNLSNGSVESLFQGEEGLVDRMLEWCKTGSPGARVDHIAQEEAAPLENCKGFDITW